MESCIDPVVVITEIGILKSSEIIDIFVTLCFLICWLNEIFSTPNLLHIKVVSKYKKPLFFFIKVKYLFNNLSYLQKHYILLIYNEIYKLCSN